MKRLAIFAFACVFASGCIPVFNSIKHDPYRAGDDAMPFLVALYYDEDVKSAYQKMDPMFRKTYGAESLNELMSTVKSQIGPVLQLKLDYYMRMPGQRALTLFYVGQHSKGTAYHRIVMAGDIRGYRVSGVFIANGPYPRSNLCFDLDDMIVVP